MKKRFDFVTNSSSSSFICCFARIADPEKAAPILEKYASDIEVYSANQALNNVCDTKWGKWLEWDWAGVDVTPQKEYIEQHMDDYFVVVSEMHDLFVDEDGDVDYDVDFSDFDTEAIDAITEENGFADIDCQCGAGRNG